jgi:hypothetical protein
MMKCHIDVSSALRQSVSETYSHLVTRPTGAAVRAYIEQELSRLTDSEVTVIDFTHVGMMDFSCADEIVAKLVVNGQRKLVFSGLSESHVEAIDAVLERHGMVLVSHEADARTFTAALIH